MTTMQDPVVTQEIITAIRGGDRQAFDALFEHVGGKVYVYIYSSMGGLQRIVDPEDVLQDVYSLAYQSFETFVAGGTGSLARWMIGIARNRIRHLHAHHFEHQKRDPRRAVPLDRNDDVASHDPSPSREIARSEEVGRMNDALAALCEDDRKAILLHIEGESIAEIARRLDLPRTTLLYRISGALRQLGEHVSD